MSKKVLILSGSPRKGGNSDFLCDKFLQGPRKPGMKKWGRMYDFVTGKI